jgi:hypothetical protein
VLSLGEGALFFHTTGAINKHVFENTFCEVAMNSRILVVPTAATVNGSFMTFILRLNME